MLAQKTLKEFSLKYVRLRLTVDVLLLFMQ